MNRESQFSMFHQSSGNLSLSLALQLCSIMPYVSVFMCVSMNNVLTFANCNIFPFFECPPASHYRSSLDPRSESKPQTRPNSTERPSSGSQGHTKIHFTKTSTPSSADRDKAHVGVSADLLSVDIQGILDDLQMDCKTVEREERARQRSRGGSSSRRGRGGSGSRTPVSAWGTTVATASSSRGCRSASPTTRRPETANSADAGQKRRHYDADTVRQYISRQQEERKRRQAEEKRALREDAERRNQRLKELYRKQRQVARTAALPSEAPVSPVQRRLQETYSKLLLEEAEMSVEATQMQAAASSSHMVFYIHMIHRHFIYM